MENINIKDTNNNVKIVDRVPEKEKKTEPTPEQREHWNQVWDESERYGYYDYVHKEWRG